MSRERLTEASDGPPAVELSGLTKYYGDVRGIEDVTLAIERGEIFGFLGPNGAGKSTAIRTLLGFLRPTSGTASILGAPVTERSARLSVLGDVGYLPGDVAFYDGVTGRALLDYLGSLRGERRRAELEARFPAPFDRPIHAYSRGNRQKIGLIQAFMHDPSLVVMDEPTSGLDPIMQNALYEFLEQERERGVTILFSSHVLSEVRRVCDRIAVIRDGRLVAVEAIDDLLERGGKVVTFELTEAPPTSAFEIEGVTRVERFENGETTSYHLLVTGNYDGLLDALGDYHLTDLDVRETSLDDVFLHFYTDDESTDGESSDGESSDGETGASETHPASGATDA